jgi:hypothetical protein
MVKEEPYVQDVQKYHADPDGFMKEEVIQEKPAGKAKAKKTTFQDVDAAQFDDTGFETVGRDGKALAYTPESILKSKYSVIPFNALTNRN